MMMVLPRRRGGGEFDPASLFAGSEKGVIIDPSDLTTMWVEHNSQTTQVAAHDDLVGTVTGFQNTTLAALSATGAASRGTYKVSGALRYINFTTTQWLQGVIGTELQVPLTFVQCTRSPAASLFATNITKPDAGNAGQWLYTDTTAGNAHTWSRTDDVGANRIDASGVAANTIVVTSHRIMSTTDVSVQVNKSARSNSGTVTNATAESNWLLAFPRIVDITPSNGAGDLFFLLVINRDLTAQELSDLQTYAGAKGGLTI